MNRSIFIGHDPREVDAYTVAERSIRAHLSQDIPIDRICMDDLRERGLYGRPTETRDGRLWDVISQVPMSTAFSIARFLTPILARRHGWALFMDCDFMARADLVELFDQADDRYAVMCVQHPPFACGETKMDGQVQTSYPRKCWSSLMLWNCEHRALRNFGLQQTERMTGAQLHRFDWLDDAYIGELDPTWNHLVGVNAPNPSAKLVHLTLGIPSMQGYETCEHADEWRRWLV